MGYPERLIPLLWAACGAARAGVGVRVGVGVDGGNVAFGTQSRASTVAVVVPPAVMMISMVPAPRQS